MIKIYIDSGHGGSDPGAVGNGLKEKDITLKIALKIREILAHEFDNVAIKMSRTGDSYPTLTERTNEANSWGANFYLSIHINSAGGTAGTGFETFKYPNSSATYQNAIHAEILKLIDMKDRGKKTAKFHVLKETKMPAVLTENGFINNPVDAAHMKNLAWIEKVARGHVNGLEKAFNLKKKLKPVTTNPSKTNELYTVQVGAFSNKDNAEKVAAELNKKGYTTYITKK